MSERKYISKVKGKQTCKINIETVAYLIDSMS